MNRKKKFLVVDVETANDTLYPLVYDIGYAVVDKEGNVYKQNSVIIRDIFCFEKELMKEMKESDESNKTFTTLLSSITLQDTNNSKQASQPVIEVEYEYRMNK